MEAWSPTDDGLGLLVKTGALREQAREVLVSAAQARTPPPLPQPVTGRYLSYHALRPCVHASTAASDTVAALSATLEQRGED